MVNLGGEDQSQYPSPMRTRINDIDPPEAPPLERATAQRLRVLDLFTRYEILPAPYINVGANVGWKPIRDLKKHHYIGVPDMEGTRPMGALNRVRPLGIFPRGEAMLGKPVFHSADNSFKHKLLISMAQFSFDRAVPELGFRKIELPEILSHPNCPEETRKAEHPNYIPIGDYHIRPDADLFGYEYNGNYFFIHGFEADRGNERANPNPEYKKKSIQSMVRNYGTYIREKIYFHRYGLVNVLVPFICDNQPALNRIMDIVHQEIEPDLWDNFPGKVLSTDLTNYAPPTAHLVTEDWTLADGSPFNIMEKLGGHPRKGETSNRAEQHDQERGEGA